MDFQPFPKLMRLAKYSQHCVITEKIDGSNAQIVISNHEMETTDQHVIAVSSDYMSIRAGSRSRWIMPGKETDNFGFAAWVEANAEELSKLGSGQHFGEWYGGKIQRGYGLTEKRFALFNTDRFQPGRDTPPECCDVVPILYEGPFSDEAVASCMDRLSSSGSSLVPGFDNPEGIVVYLRGPRMLLKKTFEFDEGKWKEAA